MSVDLFSRAGGLSGAKYTSPSSNKLAAALGLGGSFLNAVLVMEELKDNRCIGCGRYPRAHVNNCIGSEMGGGRG